MKKHLLIHSIMCSFLLAVSSWQSISAQTKTADYTLGGSGIETSAGIVPTADGGLMVGGSTFSVVSGEVTQPYYGSVANGDFWLVKLDAQGNKLWDKRFGGLNDDRMIKIIPAATGGFLLCGWSQSGVGYDKTEASRGVTDYWVVKVDDQGNKLWDKRFGSLDEDFLYTAVASPDGGCLLSGFTGTGPITATKTAPNGDRTEPILGVSDVWLVKIDAIGNKQWDKRLGGPGAEYVADAVCTADGGFAIAAMPFVSGWGGSAPGGDVSDISRGGMDYWVIKINATGTKQWDHLYGGSGIDNAKSLLATPDGGLLVGGESESPISSDKTVALANKKYWLLKLDAVGAKQWDQVYGITAYDQMVTLQLAPNGDYLLGGYTTAGNPFISFFPADYVAIRIAPNGQQRWATTIGGNGDEFLSAIIPNYNGSIILAGSSNSNIGGDKTSNSRGSQDNWLVKLTDTSLATKVPVVSTVTNSIYPNPTNSPVVIIEIAGLRQQGPVVIELLTSLGQVVHKVTSPVQKGKVFQALDLLKLPAGLYVVRVQTLDGIVAKRLIKEEAR